MPFCCQISAFAGKLLDTSRAKYKTINKNANSSSNPRTKKVFWKTDQVGEFRDIKKKLNERYEKVGKWGKSAQQKCSCIIS